MSMTSTKKEINMDHLISGKDSWLEFVGLVKTLALMNPDNPMPIFNDGGTLRIRGMDDSHVCMMDLNTGIEILGLDDVKDLTYSLTASPNSPMAMSIIPRDLKSTVNLFKVHKGMQIVMEIDSNYEDCKTHHTSLHFTSIDENGIDLAHELVDIEISPIQMTPIPDVKHEVSFNMMPRVYVNLIKMLKKGDVRSVGLSNYPPQGNNDVLTVAGFRELGDDKIYQAEWDIESASGMFGDLDSIKYDYGRMSYLKYMNQYTNSKIVVSLTEQKPIQFTLDTISGNVMNYWIAPIVPT